MAQKPSKSAASHLLQVKQSYIHLGFVPYVALSHRALAMPQSSLMKGISIPRVGLL